MKKRIHWVRFFYVYKRISSKAERIAEAKKAIVPMTIRTSFVECLASFDSIQRPSFGLGESLDLDLRGACR